MLASLGQMHTSGAEGSSSHAAVKSCSSELKDALGSSRGMYDCAGESFSRVSRGMYDCAGESFSSVSAGESFSKVSEAYTTARERHP